jgi:hypothetical protein
MSRPTTTLVNSVSTGSALNLVDPLEREKKEIERRRQRLQDRKNRILDAKLRIMGVCILPFDHLPLEKIGSDSQFPFFRLLSRLSSSLLFLRSIKPLLMLK